MLPPPLIMNASPFLQWMHTPFRIECTTHFAMVIHLPLQRLHECATTSTWHCPSVSPWTRSMPLVKLQMHHQAPSSKVWPCGARQSSIDPTATISRMPNATRACHQPYLDLVHSRFLFSDSRHPLFVPAVTRPTPIPHISISIQPMRRLFIFFPTLLRKRTLNA